ncbi:MAG TPA: nucleoside triphosphate pyrophosphatase [Gemmatimonadales bacterium]|nr:nucleoside triphosphate pyrophosphatase [Gemmatimonadales bacterium]
MSHPPLVLASGSPRRRQLLEMLRIPHQVVVPDIDETPLPAESPRAYTVRLARAKATAVMAGGGLPAGHLVLAADTTVVLDGVMFGKPESPEDAVAMLRRLQGRTHEVYTAVALAHDGTVTDALDVSEVTFRRLEDATLRAYVATGEPLDKAGAYAIQGLGAGLVEGIRGDFFGVMGLPLRLVLDLLARAGRPYCFTR